MIATGKRDKLVSLYEMTSSPTSDGDHETTLSPLDPAEAWAAIEPATPQRLERIVTGTVIAQATHVITLPYHDEVTTDTRIVWNGRQFNVVGVANPEERNIETVAVCVEQMNVAAITVQPSWVQEGWIS